MAASEAAVTAVMERLGCVRYRLEFIHPEPFVYDYCVEHSAEGEQSWTDRGCPVAVTAADAVWPIAQAEALREASHFTTEPDVRFNDLADVRDWLHDRAGRIEAQP